MPDESVCPKCGRSRYDCDRTNPYQCQVLELTRDLAAARERIADLELSVSSDGLRMNLVDSLREKRQELAAAREENERLMSEIVTQAGTILGFVESLRHMSFCRDCAEGSWEYCDGGKEALKRIDAALASRTPSL